MENLSNKDKIESYRIMADSLILSSKSKDCCTSSEGSSGNSVNQTPTWDIHLLEHESEDLMARASVRLKKLKSSYGKNVIFRWIKNWRNLRKAEQITTELDQLVPKLKSTEEELNLWLEVLRNQKSSSLSQGMKLITDLEQAVLECERNMDLFDELHNDCLQVNFDVSNMSTYLFNALTFNIEVLRELKEPRQRSASKSSQLSHGHTGHPLGFIHGHAHTHSHSHGHGHGKHRHHSGKSSKQSSKAAKASSHSHASAASSAHRSPLLNGFNATVSRASDDEGSSSPLTLENLKRLEWELRVSPGTDRTVKSPVMLPSLPRSDDIVPQSISATTTEGVTEAPVENGLESTADSSRLTKPEDLFEFLEPLQPIFSDGGSDDDNEQELDHEHEHNEEDDELVFEISSPRTTTLAASPALLPALGVPVAATVNRERRLSFEEIMEPAVWQGFSTHHHRILAHGRPSLSSMRYAKGSTGSLLYGTADGIIQTKKHNSLSAIESLSHITAMSNGLSSSPSVNSMSTNVDTGSNASAQVSGAIPESNASITLSTSSPALMPKPLTRSSSLTYSQPMDSAVSPDLVQVKSKSLSLSAIDFSSNFTSNFSLAIPPGSNLLSFPTDNSQPASVAAIVPSAASLEITSTQAAVESDSVDTSIRSSQDSQSDLSGSGKSTEDVDEDDVDSLGISSDVVAAADIPLSGSDVASNVASQGHAAGIAIPKSVGDVSPEKTTTAPAIISPGATIKETSSMEELASINAQLEAVTRAIRSLSSSPPPAAQLARSYSFNLENDRELGTFLKQETLERARYEAFVLLTEPYIVEDEDHQLMCAKLQLCQEVCISCYYPFNNNIYSILIFTCFSYHAFMNCRSIITQAKFCTVSKYGKKLRRHS